MLEYLLYALYGVLGLAALLSLCVFRVAKVRTVLTLALTLAVLGGGSLAQIWWWDTRTDTAREAVPPTVNDFNYVGSDACRSCHSAEYHSWHDTYHRTMTQVAGTESVLAPFDGRTLKRFGTTTTVMQRGDEFFAELIEPSYTKGYQRKYGVLPDESKAPRVERQIVMTTGSHQLQVYWFQEPTTGELWQFPWRYRIKEKRWVHKQDTFLEPPEDPPFINFQVWSSSCIECHAVAGQPHFNSTNGVYENARVAELGISCEACHGPGKEHCESNQNPLNRYAAYASDERQTNIINPKHANQDVSAQICGTCHSHHVFAPDAKPELHATGPQHKPGDDMLQVGRFMNAMDESVFGYGEDATRITRFWPDGACRTGGREYNGMTESECYLNGEMTCLSCHSMHNADPNKQVSKLMDTNEACFQCHQTYRENLTEHTHHGADSPGSSCYNCHMPYTSYGLLGSIRSHTIQSPKIRAFEPHGRLNACNLCHLDQTLEWSQKSFTQWYDKDTIELSDEEKSTSAAVLWLLKGDAGQRVTSAWHMGWEPALLASGKGWTVPLLAATFEDPYSAVRFNAWRSINRIPGFEDLYNEFDSEIPIRVESRQQVLKLWMTDKKLHLKRGTQTLTDDGKPDWPAINALLKQRDNSRMVINE